VVCQQDDVIELDSLASGRCVALDVEAPDLVEDVGEDAAGHSLAQAGDELSDVLLGYQEGRPDPVAPHLDQVVPLRGPAHQSEAVAEVLQRRITVLGPRRSTVSSLRLL